MKIFKYLLFLLLIFIIGASIYIATKDGSFQIEQTKMMDVPQEVVFNEVNDYTTWKAWEPWSEQADDMIISFGEKTSGEGASYSWKSEEMGSGKLVTTQANPFTSINQDITFKTPFGESGSKVYWEFKKQGDSTRVVWGMTGEQSFMEKVAFTFQDESLTDMMKPMFEKGLNNLQERLNEKMDKYSVNIDGVTQHGGGYYMYTTTASKISQVPERMQKMLTKVNNFMTINNIEQIGNPFVLYNQWNEEQGTAIFSAAYFTPSEVITTAESDILNGYLSKRKMLKTSLKGNYENLKEAWDSAYKYIEENNLKVDPQAQALEVYVKGPKDYANPAQWLTHIYIPLEEEILKK